MKVLLQVYSTRVEKTVPKYDVDWVEYLKILIRLVGYPCCIHMHQSCGYAEGNNVGIEQPVT